MIPVIYAEATAVLVGLVVGLWARKVIRSLFIIVGIAGLLATGLIVTGRGAVLQRNCDLVPQALSLGTHIAMAVRQVLIATPGAVAGLVAGIAVREIVRLARS